MIRSSSKIITIANFQQLTTSAKYISTLHNTHTQNLKDTYYGFSRNAIVKIFGKKTMTRQMAKFLAEESQFLKHIPFELRDDEIWKKIFEHSGFCGLYGLVTNGKSFKTIVDDNSDNSDFVVPSMCFYYNTDTYWNKDCDEDMTDDKKIQINISGFLPQRDVYVKGLDIFDEELFARNYYRLFIENKYTSLQEQTLLVAPEQTVSVPPEQTVSVPPEQTVSVPREQTVSVQSEANSAIWGIRFMNINDIKYCGYSNSLFTCFVPFTIEKHPYLWIVKVPDDAIISIGCKRGPFHDPIDNFCCVNLDTYLSSNKLEFVRRIKNPHYNFIPSSDYRG